MKQHKSLLYGTLLLTGTGLASQLLGFVYRIFLSRLIGAEVMGLYQLIMPVYAVLSSLSIVGLTAAVSHLSAEYQALGNHRAAGQVLRYCLIALVLVLAPLALVVLVGSDAISVYLLGDARTQLGLVLLLPCLLLTGVENLHKHAFYGAGLVRTPAYTELLEQLIRTISVLGLLLLFLPRSPEQTVGLIVAGMVICEVFSSCTLTLLHRRQFKSFTGGQRLEKKLLRHRIGAIAVPIGFTALLGNLMGSACAILIPQRLVAGGMEVSEAISAFGVLFGMSLPLLSLPTAFIAALSLVLLPKLAESQALHHRQAIHRRVSKAMLGTSVLILPTMAFLSVVGEDLGTFLFQEPTVGQYLPLLAVGVALTCYQSVLSCALNGVGRQATAAKIALFSGGVELLIVYVTVGLPQVGLLGFVWGFIISALLAVLLGLFFLYRATGLKPQLFQWLMAPGLAALLMGLCLQLLYHTLTNLGCDPLLQGLACLLFGVLLYLSTLWVQGVRPSNLFRLD